MKLVSDANFRYHTASASLDAKELLIVFKVFDQDGRGHITADKVRSGQLGQKQKGFGTIYSEPPVGKKMVFFAASTLSSTLNPRYVTSCRGAVLFLVVIGKNAQVHQVRVRAGLRCPLVSE